MIFSIQNCLPMDYIFCGLENNAGRFNPYADKEISNALLHSEGNFAWLPTTFNIGNTIAHRFCSV